MKSRFTKMTAVVLAMSMCVPTVAFASENKKVEGSFETSFDVYSPKLTVDVPVKADIQVNPMADTQNATDVKKFTIASNSIDILNASVDADADAGIPVNVTVKAAITSKKDDVVTAYNTFAENNTSTKKKVHMNLSTAQTAAVIGVKTGGTAAFDSEKKLDLKQYEVTTKAVYTTPVDSTPITGFGSLLSVDIAAPATSDTTAGAKFTSDATKVTPAVGSFAVTGVANTNADWKADDVTVAITYNVKASAALGITTPAIATAPTFTAGTSAADVNIVIPNVGESTVTAMALHNDNPGLYGDFVFEDGTYEVAYAPNATTTTQTDATITIAKENDTLAFLTGADYSGKAQDLVIALSDGRYVVTTLTVTAAPATP